MNGVSEEACPEEEQCTKADAVLEDALSNYAILRNIFSILNDEELELCCHVSQYWRTVADPLVFLHYDIQFGKDMYYGDPLISDEVFIKARSRYNRKTFTEHEYNFQDTTEKLGKVLVLTQNKVTISLKFFPNVDIRSDRVKIFLSKFGPLVLDLCFMRVATLPLNQFFKLLLNSFPNLQKLNLTGLRFEEDSVEDRNFNVDLPQNKHKHLRKIHFRHVADCNFQDFLTILKFAPKVDEIQFLPLYFINALVVAQKGQALKSVIYPAVDPHLLTQNGETLLTAFQKLAQLQPKLTSFSLLPSTFPKDADVSFEMIKPWIFSVLESSTGSLESLLIPPTEVYGFQNFPRLEALKMIEFNGFTPLNATNPHEGVFFPAEISLTEIFPNVIEIHIIKFRINEDFITRYLPENIISPWGSQIQILKVDNWIPLDSMTLLQRRFPSIQKLKLISKANLMGELWPALAHLWPELKSLTIDVNCMYIPIPNYPWPGMLDCAFTGLSEEVVAQLRGPLTRAHFTNDELQRFRDESPMVRLKELQELKLIFKDSSVDREYAEELTRLTPVANEFGFALLPHLKVTVGIWRKHSSIRVIKASLEQLGRSDNIYIDDYYFEVSSFQPCSELGNDY